MNIFQADNQHAYCDILETPVEVRKRPKMVVFIST